MRNSLQRIVAKIEWAWENERRQNQKTKQHQTTTTMTSAEVAIVGEGGVGKSAITIQFVQNHFVDEYDPTIEDSYRKMISVDDQPVVLDLLDTAGQEEFSSMRGQYMRSCDAFLLVYSVTSRRSFESVDEFREQIIRAKGDDEDENSCPIVLVGNKCDLEREREVGKKEGEEKAKVFGYPFLELSAKRGENVEESFIELVKQMRKKEKERECGNGKKGKKGKKGGKKENMMKKKGCAIL